MNIIEYLRFNFIIVIKHFINFIILVNYFIIYRN